MRYQSIVDENNVACRHIMLYGNSSYPVPKDLYVSCPFSDAAYERSPYRLEYLAGNKNNEYYSKKYIFYVPQHTHIGKFFSRHSLFTRCFVNSLTIYVRVFRRGQRTNRNFHSLYLRGRVRLVECGGIHTTASRKIQRDGV